MQHHPPITAIVVSRNEAAKLEACLHSLAWCDELIVVDMESTDDTVAVARRFTSLILHEPFYPIAESARIAGARIARNDWLLMVDPDEQFPPALVEDIYSTLSHRPDAAAVKLPWQFYFKGKLLDGTIWGGPGRFKRFLVHRQRCELRPLNHRQATPMTGPEITIAPTAHNHVVHDWASSYWQLIEKHARYIYMEGQGLHESGRRLSFKLAFVEPLVGFKRSMVDMDGWRLGFRGLALSLIYASWLGGSALSLLFHQIRRRLSPQTFSPPVVSLKPQVPNLPRKAA